MAKNYCGSYCYLGSASKNSCQYLHAQLVSSMKIMDKFQAQQIIILNLEGKKISKDYSFTLSEKI